MNLRIDTESDSPHHGSYNLFEKLLTRKDKLNSILDMLPSSIRKTSFSLQSWPVESQLNEVQVSFGICKHFYSNIFFCYVMESF